ARRLRRWSKPLTEADIMAPTETSFNSLLGIPVHYNRLPPPNGYGRKGTEPDFPLHPLKSTLEEWFEALFEVWNRERPTLILTAGTTVSQSSSFSSRNPSVTSNIVGSCSRNKNDLPEGRTYPIGAVLAVN